jgi:hypothetical protein
MITLGKDSSAPFPMVESVWNMFAGKGIRTSFLSVGTSSSCQADLELAESIGCPLHVFPFTETEKEQWAEVSGILKARKRDPATAKFSFSEGAEARWVLPKNLRVLPALPWWNQGTMDLSGCGTIQTSNFGNAVSSLCTEMKIKDQESRVDIVKVDTSASAPGLEIGVLGAMLHVGYRPAIVLVHWNKLPDVDMSTTIAAGHLQNCGYTLLKRQGNNFLYYFVDEDVYQTCSWEDENTTNPLVSELSRRMAMTRQIRSSRNAPA